MVAFCPDLINNKATYTGSLRIASNPNSLLSQVCWLLSVGGVDEMVRVCVCVGGGQDSQCCLSVAQEGFV